MAKRWKYIEPAVTITGALLGLPPHAMAGAIGSGKWLAAKLENSERYGLDDEAFIKSVRAAAFRAADRFDDDAATRDARTEADALLAKHLLSCLPSRTTLVTLFRKGDPAQNVAEHVADALAEHDSRFADGAAPIAGLSARTFACAIVRTIVEAALANKDYAQKLLVHLGIETLQEVVELKEDVGEVKEVVGEIKADVADIKDDLSELVALMRAQKAGASLTDQALRGAIARFIAFQPEASDADVLSAVAKFESDYRALLDQVSRIQVHDNHIQSLKNAAEEALEAGDIATARTRYAEAAKAATDKVSEPVRNAATLKAAEASTALAMLDWQAADAAWDAAAAMLTPFDLDAGEAIAWEAGGRLKTFGETFAQTPALAASERRWRALADAAGKRGDSKRVAAMQNNLGLVLWVQGERTGGAAGLALLDEAVAAYRAALTVYTQAEMPADWAMTQNNLGLVLWVQGERTSGAAGLALLDEAVAAYRAALTVRTQAEMPADWAMTQNNLGNVLRVQGARTGGEAGLALLGEAVAAYRAALTVYTQAEMPAQWAMTQNNLGAVLSDQGERTEGEAGLALLGEAVAAYRAALIVYTQAEMPAQWAMTQNNLGNVLQVQGARTGGEAGLGLLSDAVAAYRAALTVHTQADMPADWAMTQNNLGNVLSIQGKRTGGEAGLVLLSDAVAAYRAALTVHTQAEMHVQWAMTQENIGLALVAQAWLTPGDAGVSLLRAAISAYQAALTVFTSEHMPYNYEKAQRHLAKAEAALAARLGGGG